MAQTDIRQLFHEWSGRDSSQWDQLPAELSEQDRTLLLELLQSDAQLQSDDDFLKPIVIAGESTLQIPPLEQTVIEATAATDREFPAQIGDYRVLNVIAVHGQGVVYRADHMRLNRQVVIKVVKDELNESARQALVEEGRSLASLSHPNIAQIFDLTMHDWNPCLVMEYIDGRNLSELHSGCPLPAEESAALVRQIATGMEHAHSNGIIHRDLKPANVVIRATDQQPKIIDFGLARARHAFAGATDSSGFGGTIAFMAPEQARWIRSLADGQPVSDPTDERTDVFAIGAILYSLLTGGKLYEADSQLDGLEKAVACNFDRDALRHVNAPAWVRDACLKALAAEPRDRFRSAAELAAALTPPKRIPWPRLIGGGLIAALVVYLVMDMSGLFGNSSSDPTKDADAAVVSAPVMEPPQVEFTHYHYPAGADTGISYRLLLSAGVVEDDDLDLKIGFKQPAYCFVVALNPNGSVQLCYPEQGPQHVQPDAVLEIKYPAEVGKSFPFTDGLGQQVFLVIWSNEKLPSFTDWSAGLGDFSDVAAQTKGHWIWKDSDIQMWPAASRIGQERAGTRTTRALRGSAAFVELCQRLEKTGCRVYAVTFPVTEAE